MEGEEVPEHGEGRGGGEGEAERPIAAFKYRVGHIFDHLHGLMADRII